MRDKISRLGIVLSLAGLLAGCGGAEEKAEVAVAPVEPTPVVEVFGLFPEIVHYQPTYPSGACLTEEEARADQLTKLRTELMVTGLTCPTAYRDPKLYVRYVNFTVNHQEELRESQQVLGRLLGRMKSGNNNRLFDTFITEMANAESQNVSGVGAGRYCLARQEQFFTVATYDDQELENYLDEAVARYRHQYKLCD